MIHTGVITEKGLERVFLDPRPRVFWVAGVPGDYSGNEAFEHAAEHVCGEAR